MAPIVSQSSRVSLSVMTAELLVIALLTIAGVGLRVWQPSHMAVEHFDEGVYASNLYCALNGNAYPFRHLYAPPLLPGLLEWSLVLSGGKASSVMWANVLAGCLMVPSVWWVGRTWFGPLAGMTAAGLAAISAIHIQYSRAALTDGLLCLWMLWGVYWAWRAITTGRPRAIILAGVFASLAWWTKYNGWLTLAISGAGTAAWLVAPRAGFATHFPHFFTPACARWGLVAVIAFVGWAPVLISLQNVGGYAAVSANHAKYFVGLAGWPSSFAHQAANLSHYHHGLGLLAILLVVIAMGFLATPHVAGSKPDSGGWGRPKGASRRNGAGGSESLDPSHPSPRATPIESTPGDPDGRLLAGWMLAAWFLALLVAVPLYTPYPRLTLPWVVAAWLVMGAAVALLSRFVASRVLSPTKMSRSVPASRWPVALLLLVAASLTQGVADERNHITADRRGLREITGQMLDAIAAETNSARRDTTVVISVVAEPGLFFHLAAMAQRRGDLNSDVLVLPAADYGVATAPAVRNVRLLLATGPHAPPLAEQPEEVRSHLTRIDEWAYWPSDLVRLDEHGPQVLEGREALCPRPVRLYRVIR